MKEVTLSITILLQAGWRIPKDCPQLLLFLLQWKNSLQGTLGPRVQGESLAQRDQLQLGVLGCPEVLLPQQSLEISQQG